MLGAVPQQRRRGHHHVGTGEQVLDHVGAGLHAGGGGEGGPHPPAQQRDPGARQAHLFGQPQGLVRALRGLTELAQLDQTRHKPGAGEHGRLGHGEDGEPGGAGRLRGGRTDDYGGHGAAVLAREGGERLHRRG